MATFVKRSGKWGFKYRDHNGKQIWVTGYTDKKETQRLADERENAARRIKLGDIDPAADSRRIERAKPSADHLAAFKASMQANARSDNHVAYTVRDVRLCIERAGITSASALTRAHVDQWRTFCRTVGYPEWHSPTGPAKPDSRKTVNRRVSSVRAFLNYLQETGAVERNILSRFKMLETKGHETRHRRALTLDEAKALIEKTPDAHRRTLYLFALRTGFRRAECESMTPASFDFAKRTVKVNAADAKYKGEHQILPMHPALVGPLQALCKGKARDAAIFAVPRKQIAVSVLHADCAVAGVDTREIDFHALRHSFITHLADQNIRPEVLMKLARHRDIRTTLKHYVHFRPDDERSALERLGS
ncbi:MAG TPA: tyrosine-type recombinase/integrase [Tepidisphaeraceae bacterium]|nr:tyrosine-type recombinase/integrase [Tepidisphaeraceae bacterium]